MASVVTSEWTPVDLGDVEIRGVVWGWDRAWVYGYRRPASDLVPYVAHVRDGGAVTAYEMPSRGWISSVYLAGSELAVCMGESPVHLAYIDSLDSVSQPRFVEREETFFSG